jgi:hypothetical protein|tara:strand:- start:164 stop:1858 length:1695 start_codon:yes stop_codon:yes gene_type:complete
MANVWKKVQRADSDFTGDVTGLLGGVAAATVVSGAAKGALAPKIFRQSGIPTALNAGDFWMDSDDKKMYRATAAGDDAIGGGEWIDVSPDKTSVGLNNVDNTSDETLKGTLDKDDVGLGNVLNSAQVTTFTQDAIPTSLAIGDIWMDSDDGMKMYRAAGIGATTIAAGAWVLVALQKGALGLLKGDVGLGNVDNTTDALKPVSTAQGVVNALKAPLASPTFTGTVAGVTKTHVGLSSVTNDVQLKATGSNAPNSLKNSQITLTDSSGTVTLNNAGAGTITATKLALGNVDNVSDANKPVSTAQATVNALKAPLASPTFTGTIGGLAKGDVGLGNVDNTTDALKPVSTAQATVNALKAPLASPTFTGTIGGLAKGDVGLGNVDNTTDALKPVSTAQGTVNTAQGVTNALKAPLASPTFTGTVAGVTKAHVGLTNVIDQAITVSNGALKFGSSTQTLDEDSVSNSAALGGSSLATVKSDAVGTAETNIIGGAPGALNTLDELAAALNDSPTYVTSTIVNSIATKGKAAMAITANDAANSSYDNNPASESEGQLGIYNGQQYVVVNV